MAPRKSSSGSGLLGLAGSLVVLGLVLVTMSTLGAHLMRVAQGRVSRPVAFAATLVAVLLVCIVVPLLLDRKMVIEARKHDPKERGMFPKTAALVNTIVLLFLVFALPRTTRSALTTQGDWLARSLVPSLSSPAREAATWAAARLPRSGGDEPTEQPSSQPGAELTPQQIFEKLADTVVVIRMVREIEGSDALGVIANEMDVKRLHGLGSGFLVESSGVVVTNHHVVERAEGLEVSLRDRRVFSTVDLLLMDVEHDLALVRVDATGLPVATVAPDDSVAPGARAIAIGAPLGLEYSITDGIVSAVRTIQGTTFLQMQTTVAPGSSGGPLFDALGRVIGVSTATREAGLNLAVAARHVRDLLAKPRSPRRLAPFVRGPVLADVSVEGAETSSIDRMTLGQALEQVMMVVEGCALGPVPDDAKFTISKAAETQVDPTVASNLDEASTKCLAARARYGVPTLFAWLVQNRGTALASGKDVALKLRIEGFGAGPTEPGGKRLDLWLRVVAQPANP